MTRLDDIKARCEAATNGPWKVHRYSVDDWNGNQICGDFTHEEDKAFIAHARGDIPWLLAEAEKDNTTTVTRDICYEHGEIVSYGAEQCNKCGAKQPDRYPYCPGCGRRIER